jgi:hypothetical protein
VVDDGGHILAFLEVNPKEAQRTILLARRVQRQFCHSCERQVMAGCCLMPRFW